MNRVVAFTNVDMRGKTISISGRGVPLHPRIRVRESIVKRFVTSTKPEEDPIVEAVMINVEEELESTEEKSKIINIVHTISEKVGRVDDSRIVFQELQTGEVPRLYRYVYNL